MDVRTGKPAKRLECYKCQSQIGLLVEEKVDTTTGKVLGKEFICLPCSQATYNEPF